MMSPHQPIVLQAGSLEAHVHPACGGRIGRFFKRMDDGQTFDFLMPLAGQPFDSNTWPKAGCFPMLPFADKLVDNRLRWNGRTVEVADPEGAPWFHGWGLRSAWDVVERSSTACEMRMRFEASSRWPWSFAGRLRIEIDPDGMDIVLSITSLSHETMPAAIGIHPYFRWPEGTHAEVRGHSVWIADSGIPGSFQPYNAAAADAWFAGEKDLQASPPNLFYKGWNGESRIAYAGQSMQLVLSSREPAFLTTFAPKNGAGYVCLEPGTCLPGHFGHGLPPGESQRVHLRLGTV